MKKLLSYVMTGFCLTTMLFCCADNGFAQGANIDYAYELRMEGRADTAKTILETTLEKDSTNAWAWFELSRNLNHIRLGNPRKMMETKEIIRCADKAIKYDPSNALFYYYRAQQEIGNLYIKLMTEKPNEEIIASLLKSEDLFLKANQQDQAYSIGKLTLVEMFSQLPPEMGGNKDKASFYALELKDQNAFYAAKAQSILLPDTKKELDHWLAVNEQIIDDPRVLEALGKTCLHESKIDEAQVYFDKAIALDKKFKVLYLEMGRYYMMQIMQDFSKKDEYIPKVETMFNKYLEVCPQTPNPVKAWVYSNLAKLKMHSGQEEDGKKLMEKANNLDPHHSKAFGFPNIDASPKNAHKQLKHGYYFRPF